MARILVYSLLPSTTAWVPASKPGSRRGVAEIDFDERVVRIRSAKTLTFSEFQDIARHIKEGWKPWHGHG